MVIVAIATIIAITAIAAIAAIVAITAIAAIATIFLLMLFFVNSLTFFALDKISQAIQKQVSCNNPRSVGQTHI